MTFEDTDISSVEADSTVLPEGTTTSELENQQSESESTQADQTDERRFTQAEVDHTVKQRLARAQRKWDREKPISQSVTQSDIELNPDSFESNEAYTEALVNKKAEEIIRRRETEQSIKQIKEAFNEREEQAMDRYDDYEQVVRNPILKITDTMADTITLSDNGPEIAYWLGSNPEEALRISKLTHLAQAKEIGKIEQKLLVSPIVKKSTSAPDPIIPGNSKKSSRIPLSTTDPRSVGEMSAEEWIKAEEDRQRQRR